MAIVEDAASVLEQFVHDVANLPAEIHHLLEEIQAKDQVIQECRNVIISRDNSIQKFIKLNGSQMVNPKEEAYGKAILQNYEKAQVLQDEKVALSEKAAVLLDRHIKRLDIKIRDLQNDGSMPLDPSIPSLLRESTGNLVPPASSLSAGASGVSTPLNPLSVNTTGGTANIANAAVARMISATNSGRVNSSATAGMQPHPLLNQALGAAATQRQRETSVSSDTKRRRLNATLGNLPAAPSALARPASVGPGTPKAGTPGSRAGSAGPRLPKKTGRRLAPHQQIRKKIGKGVMLKKSARRLLATSKASPSTTGDDESALSEEDASEEGNASGAGGQDGVAEEEAGEGDEDEGDDNTKYCICHNVSYGDMVACDNEDCPYQWFHWGCIGITREPVGDWLCPHCSRLPPNQIKKAR